MAFADSAGTRMYYDDRGHGEPVLLCLPGLWVRHTMFLPVAERLSAHHRVLAVDWPGHGQSQASHADFGFAEMLTDVLAVIQASGAQSVIPVTQAHAGWIAVALRQRLGDRVPKAVFISWNPVFTSHNPLASTFLGAMESLQDQSQWRDAAELLLSMWLSQAPPAVNVFVREDMATNGFEDWARAAREITAAYAHEGDPLQTLSAMSPPVPALHLYAQPRAPEYLAAQETFARDHLWFVVRRLDAASHFPTLEVPDATAEVIREFIQ
jgi:pimeloyl-ACP methyl ester carboxylesterase